MRVALVGPTYPFRGGIAHYTTLLAQHLADRHDVLFVSFSHQYPKWLFPGRTDRDPSLEHPDVDAARILAPLRPWTWWRAARRIGAFGADITLVQWWVPFWAPSLGTTMALARRACRSPVVYVCHNVLPHEGAGAPDRALARFALGRGDGFIVHSDADEAALRALLPAQTARSNAVRRAVLPAHTIAQPVDRSAARRSLRLPPEAPVALFFGFVRPYKGLEHLLEAVPMASERVPDLRLVVAGEFWRSADRFRERARSLGVAERVVIDDRYIPNEEVGRYFAAADVLVLPYVDATQSGVVSLASEFDLPVIATRVGGLPEVVTHGDTGLIVPPADPAALADALADLLTDDRLLADLRRGVSEARARFGWEALVELVETMAASLARDGRS